MAGKRLGFGEKYHSILTIIAQPRVPSVDETKVVLYGPSMLSDGKPPGGILRLTEAETPLE